MEDSKQIKVKNRSHSPVVYVVPDMNNLRREFSGLEEKIVTFEELRKLNGTIGGHVLLKEFLIVRDDEAIEALGLHVEPEYYYGKDEVIRLLKEGSMDEFLDCLDFAPYGVIDLVKEYAVTLPLNDVAKREALLEKCDYDVNKIIEVRKATLEGQEEEEKKSTKRRAAVPNTDSTGSDAEKSSGRRVSVDKK